MYHVCRRHNPVISISKYAAANVKISYTDAHYLDVKFNKAKSMILRVGYSYEAACAELSIDGCDATVCV